MFYKRLIINDVELMLAVNQTGEGPPTSTTPGSAGILYMDTRSGDFYKCVSDAEPFVWQPLATGGGSGGGTSFVVDNNTLKLENGILSVNTTNAMEQDNTRPITSAGVYATVGNIEAILKTI